MGTGLAGLGWIISSCFYRGHPRRRAFSANKNYDSDIGGLGFCCVKLNKDWKSALKKYLLLATQAPVSQELETRFVYFA